MLAGRAAANYLYQSEVSMNKKVHLAHYDVSSEIFNRILQQNKSRIVIASIAEYQYGYSSKKKIIYNGKDQLICRELYINPESETALWKQIIVKKDDSLDAKDYHKEMMGSTAWHRMLKILHKYYTQDELLAILANNTHEQCKPLHFNPSRIDNVVYRYTNCYKYDINSAYASAYINLFPKAHDDIMALYLGRHENPDNKKILNYFNGMLKRRGFAGTYYWVVNRTNEIMNKALNEVGGVKLYINTDGFIVKNPAKLIKHSTELGKFKLEYSGDVYVYVDKNYTAIQTGTEIKGNVMCMVRDKIDLSKGQVVHYRKTKKILKDATLDSDEVSILVADNIIEDKVEVYGI